VKSRIVASGVVALAMASVAVPAALSGSASAKPTSTAAPTVTGCKPTTATIGKSVTIHGTGLAGATSVTIGTTKHNTVTITSFTKDTKKFIKLKTPTGKTGTGVTAASDNVIVTTANGPSTAVSCTFKAAPKKSKK
jgi:hypothetical protein